MKEKIAQEKEELEKASPPQESQSPDSSDIGSLPVSQESTTLIIPCEVESKDSDSGTSLTTTTDSELMQVDEVKTEIDEVKIEVEEDVVQITKEPETKNDEKLEELSPFEELIRVASLLNPKQFELPAEMTEPFPFPGTERVEPIRNGRRVKNKRLVELDSHGCVPLPAKLCFSCKKSCKRAPLISCDYCTLFFHQDCLDPPMTALPAGRWMCPNHPQHFIVSFFYC